MTDNVTEDRVAPRTAAGRRLALYLNIEVGLVYEGGWLATQIAEVEAEAASLDRDELRKAVEALPHADVRGTDLSEPGEGDAIFVDADEWADVIEKDAVLALLSAGDKAEAPR